MKLYHFTADRFMNRILKDGLAKGMFPLIHGGRIFMLGNTQWLTSNPDFDTQDWYDAQTSRIPYDRTANRITVSIPKSYRNRIFTAEQIQARWGHVFLPDFFYPEDHVNWHIFVGKIKPNWFREIKRKDAT